VRLRNYREHQTHRGSAAGCQWITATIGRTQVSGSFEFPVSLADKYRPLRVRDFIGLRARCVDAAGSYADGTT
jgi:hypothetical protein